MRSEGADHGDAALQIPKFCRVFLFDVITGGILNASTVLQPQFTQQITGYTATIAGLALSGGVVCFSCSRLPGRPPRAFPRAHHRLRFILYTCAFFYRRSPEPGNALALLRGCELCRSFRFRLSSSRSRRRHISRLNNQVSG
jgi:hypothetical protein